jgi:Putative beta-barrel porin-2, OmpL-like. bbp2
MLSYSISRLANVVLLVAMLTTWVSPAAATSADTDVAASENSEQRITELSQEVEQLKVLVHQLQEQVSKLAGPVPVAGSLAAAQTPVATTTAATAQTAPTRTAVNMLSGITVNALLDGYYEDNLNSPVGRVNYLRAYDVSSNSFSLNQADLIVESAADVAADKRFGMRLDFQFGQATSTLQGNPANELRPEVYRNVYQAYGTYIFPLANGLTVDFGKWASSLGMEGNYTKDQLNYSRSFWFDYLPFYHMGIRSSLAINDQLAVILWITNGTNQTEAFNNYKDQLYGLVLTPIAGLSWTLNYYNGQEHPDVVYLQSLPPGQQNLPNEQGTYILPIANAPNGRLQVADSYIMWQVSQALTLAAEGDDVQERLYSYSVAQRVDGGALYVGYKLAPKVSLAVRAEYLADIGGLFSGVTQYLKEGTLTLDYRPVDGFLVRGELRRDQSNIRYFPGHSLGFLENAQPTIGLGLVWWFGQKQGTW